MGCKIFAVTGRLVFAAFAAVATFAFVFAVNAAPHNGEEFLLRQPDGSLVRTIVWGDEFYQDVESPDGYTLVRDKDGWICYAELSADGSEYVSAGVRYTGGSRASGSRKGLRIHKNSISEKHRRNREVLGYDELIAPRPKPPQSLKKSTSSVLPDGISPAPLAEPKKVIGVTLLIDFPDQKSNITQAAMTDFCNRKGGVNGTNSAGSVYDYFYDVSNGLLEYTNIVTPFVTVDSNKTYYDRGTNYQYVPELLTSALNKLKAAGFDLIGVTTELSGSGTNRRETVVALNVFYAGSASQGWANGIWPHSGTYRPPTGQSSVTIDGIGFGKYQLSGLGTGNNPPGIGTFVHENGHMVMGWPDLYSYESPTHSNGVGNWCVMNSSNGNNPQQPNAYLRALAGWIDTTNITNAAVGTVFSHEANGHTAYVYGRNSQEFYYIEARRRTSSAVDPRNSAIPGSGLAVWHIYTRGDNTKPGTPRIALVQADGKNDLEKKVNAGDGTDLFRVRVNTAFNKTSAPAAVYHDGVTSNIDIAEVSDSGAVMTFRIGGAGGPPTWYLTVVNGIGGGYYEAGAEAVIAAPDTNAIGRGFMRWTSAALEPDDIYACTTTVATVAAEATVTAQFARAFSLPGAVEADTFGYAQGFTSASNTANGATGNRVARVTDTSRFAEYLVDIADDGMYTFSFRLLTSSSSAGKFVLKDMTNGAVFDTVTVPTSTRTSMQMVTGRAANLKKGRAVWRIEQVIGNYSIDWFAAEVTGGTPVVKNSARAPITYGIRVTSSGNVNFQIPDAEYVSVRVYDVRGRMVAVLCDGVRNPGVHNVKISSHRLSQGLYLVRMKIGGYSKDIRLSYSR